MPPGSTTRLCASDEEPTLPARAAWLREAEGAANPLLAAAGILLDELHHTPASLEDYATAQRRWRLEHEVRMFASVCSDLRLPAAQVRDAGYCLCTALDEAAAQTAWGKNGTAGIDWQENGLAAATGHDRQGGDRVFRLIDEAMRSPRGNLDILEVYQRILELGFRGRYRFEAGGQERLQALQAELDAVIATGRHAAAPPATDAGPEREHGDQSVFAVPARRPAMRWRVLGIAGAMLFGAAGYAVFSHFTADLQPRHMHAGLYDVTVELRKLLRAEMVAGNVVLESNPAGNGVSLRFADVFAPGDPLPSPLAASLLTAVGRTIAGLMPEASVRVAGYADSAPVRQSSNQALSEARARAVAQILEASGLPAQRITVSGNGDGEPLADNRTVEGRAKNRRVEISVSD